LQPQFERNDVLATTYNHHYYHNPCGGLIIFRIPIAKAGGLFDFPTNNNYFFRVLIFKNSCIVYMA